MSRFPRPAPRGAPDDAHLHHWPAVVAILAPGT